MIKRIIGIGMLAAFFAATFAACVIGVGFWNACLIWGSIILFMIFLVLAVEWSFGR